MWEGKGMAQQNSPISKSDFDTCNWQKIIEQCDQKDCRRYMGLFSIEAEKSEEAEDTKAQEVFLLLYRITSLYFKLDNNQDPFGPLFTSRDGQPSFIVDHLTDEHIQVLIEVVPEVADPEMQARMADVLYIRTRNASLAGIAIYAYLASADTLMNPDHWILNEERIERALQLATRIGRKNRDYFPKTIQAIEDLLGKYGEEDTTFFSAKLMRLLVEQCQVEHYQGKSEDYANLAEKAAKRAETDHEWHRAQEYWEIRGEWQKICKVPGWKDATLKVQAEVFINASEVAAQASPPNYTNAAWHMQSAIELLQKVSIKQERERIQQLYPTFRKYQEEARAQMGRIVIPFDITNEQEKVRAQVKGKKFLQALFDLAYIGSPPHIKGLRELVIEDTRRSVFSGFMSAEVKDNTGRTVGQRPPLFSNGTDIDEQALRAEMFRLAIWHQLLHAINWVEVARQQICLEHNIRIHDFLPLVSNNPFVPLGREMIYARGFHAGLTGDTLVAAHLLLPQLENSIRSVLIRQDCITSMLDKERIQDEFPLNKILRDYQRELENMFGEDIVFDLRGLLVERFGSNLRNAGLHGLMDYEDFLRPQSVYLWWLALRLCCMMRLAEMPQAKEDHQEKQGDDKSST